MNATRVTHKKVLVMGIGNTLLQDDGVGVHVTRALRSGSPHDLRVDFVDGGTLGLSLLPEIESADCLIVVDAGETGGRPGDIRIYENEAMDRRLSGRRTSVHELAMSDLLDAARLTGRGPARRALVAIQPSCTDWGLEPTETVREAIPRACGLVGELAARWAG